MAPYQDDDSTRPLLSGLLSQDDAIRRPSQSHTEVGREINEARQATERELSLSVRDSLRLYKKAVVFSVILSTAVVMEGYDTSLMSSFLGFPPFEARYGDQTDPDNPGQKIISAPWQSGLQNAVQVGSIIGLAINGIVSEMFGYKKTMIVSLVLIIAFIFLPFFAQNLQTILAGDILLGIPWGIFQTLTVTYASDVTPTNLRAYLTTYVNLCWVLGQLFAAGVLRGFLNRTDQWAYRIPFALQWIWPVPIMIGAFLAPESPWWLVRMGRYDEARNSLNCLVSKDSGVPFNVDDQLAMIRSTDEMEKAMSSGTSYADCFRGIDGRRTEIACMAWITQSFCGAALMGYSVQFYERAGLDASNAFNFNIAQYAMGFIGTVGAWFLMKRMGRRTLYIWGLAVMLLLLLIIGCLGFVSDRSAGWGVGSLLLVYTFIYDITVGPVCYSVVAEIPSTRLRVKTVVLARNFYNVGCIINNILMPQFIGIRAWNLGAKTAFIWAGCCVILLTWTYFRLPEPKGRTYGELDVLFEHKVDAREFSKTKVNQFSGGHSTITGVGNDTTSGNSDSTTHSRDAEHVKHRSKKMEEDVK